MPDWLTYAQAGERFGISADAVRFRARRQGWRMQPGNDGRTLVLVPDDAAVHPRSSAVRSPDRSADQSGDQFAQTEGAAHYIEALQVAIAALRETKDGEIATLHGVIEGLQASISRAEDRAGRAEAARDEERARADALRDRLNAQVMTAETIEARAAAQRERLDTMQAQLTEAHAALQAAVETERRAARAEQEIAGERTRADDLRMQIDVLNGETIVARAEAERALSEEQVRADHLSARVDTVQREVDQSNARADGLEHDRTAAVVIANEAVRAAEAARAEAQEAQEAAEALRQADAARKARGLVGRLRAAWRGE